MRLTIFAALLVLLGTSSTGVTQQPAAHRVAPGTVTGHILCADTQRPARLAKVALVAAPTSKDLTGKASEQYEKIGGTPATDYVETGIDGSFTLSNVAPGNYFLIVDAPGYTLPLARFTNKNLISKDEAIRARIAKDLQVINVRSNATVNQEVSIERGGSVNGTVTYDDGSRASGLNVNVLSKDATGKWAAGVVTRYRSSFGFIVTDDRGRYRVSGLPPGEYIVEVDLTLSQYSTTTSHLPGHPDQTTVMRMQRQTYSLPLFSGSALRQSAAVPFTLGTSEDRTGIDLEFPLSKLHSVTGQVVAKDGHALNGGTVSLLNADDSSQVTSATIDPNDDLFHLVFVPEGDFILKVSGGKDTTKVQIANPSGETPRTHEEDKTLRTYGDAKQPLKVQNETQGIIITVPEAGGTAQSTSTASD